MGAPRTSSKALTYKGSDTLQRLFEQEKPVGISGANLSGPTSAMSKEADELVSMISYCTYVFTFTDPSESPCQQDLKRQKLVQILYIIRSSKKLLTNDCVLSPLVSMLAANLFRPLPPPAYSCLFSDSPDEDSPAMAFVPSWPHLHIVYDILATFAVNADAKALRNHLDHAFLRNLVALFQSEDPRERDRLKNVYHQIYSKLVSERSFMRKSMTNVFLHFAFETEWHCGIGELLEIWGAIINGFTVPLKEEHKLFLMRVLIPLHKPKRMHGYHRQLSYCVTQLVQKEPVLGGVVLRGILRYWPVSNFQKEVLLIGELEDLVECMPTEQLENLAVPLCSQIARSLNSFNSQVAERALYVWNNERFVAMASQFMEDVLPSLVEGIEKNIERHWCKSVQQLTMSVKKMLEDMEPALYSKCLHELQRRESIAGQEELKRKERWERLEMAAAINSLLIHRITIKAVLST